MEDIINRLKALDLELEEGDITEKGYNKKRAQLLEDHGGEEALEAYKKKSAPPKPAGRPACTLPRSGSAKGLAPTLPGIPPPEDPTITPRPISTTSTTPPPKPLSRPNSTKRSEKPARPTSGFKDGVPIPPKPMSAPPKPKPAARPPSSMNNSGSNASLNEFEQKNDDTELTASQQNFKAMMEQNLAKQMGQQMSFGMARQVRKKSLDTILVLPDKEEEKEERRAFGTLRRSFTPSGVQMSIDNLAVNHEDSIQEQIEIPAGSVTSFFSSYHPPKSECLTYFNDEGKEIENVTYSKQYERVQRFGTTFLEKLNIKKGEKVGLMIPEGEAATFFSCFFGCLYVGIIPVICTLDFSNPSMSGLILSSAGISHILTTNSVKSLLPKAPNGEPVKFPEWPMVNFIWADRFSAISKPVPPANFSPNDIAYVRPTFSNKGEVKNVEVTHGALFTLLKDLNDGITEGKEKVEPTEKGKRMKQPVTVSACSFTSDFGLINGIFLPMFQGYHLYYVPSSFALSPLINVFQIISRNKAAVAMLPASALSSSVSRVRGLKLKCLELLIFDTFRIDTDVFERFVGAFADCGLSNDVIRSVAVTPEALNITCNSQYSKVEPKKVHLDIQAVTQNVVNLSEKPDEAICFRDSGKILNNAKVLIVDRKSDRVCSKNEIGEIVVKSQSHALGYSDLPGKTREIFEFAPQGQNDYYTRSGLLGFFHEKELFICGKVSQEIYVDEIFLCPEYVETIVRKLNRPISDTNQNLMIYGSKFSVFSVTLQETERLVVVFESEATQEETDLQQWMKLVFHLIQSYLACDLFSLILVAPDSLPCGLDNNVETHIVKAQFLKGTLSVVGIRNNLCATIPHLQKQKAGVMCSAQEQFVDILSGAQALEYEGRDVNEQVLDDNVEKDMDKFNNIGEILRWRAQVMPDFETHFHCDLNKGRLALSKPLTFKRLHDRADRLAFHLSEKLNLNVGSKVGLYFEAGVDFITAFYACLYIGAIPIPIDPSPSLSLGEFVADLKNVSEVLANEKTVAVLTNDTFAKFFLAKESCASALSSGCLLYNGSRGIKEKTGSVSIISISDVPTSARKPDSKSNFSYHKPPTSELIAFIEYKVSPEGAYVGVVITHNVLIAHCRAQKDFSGYSNKSVIQNTLSPYYGLGLAFYMLLPVYTCAKIYHQCNQSSQLFFQTMAKASASTVLYTYTQMQSVFDEYSVSQNMDNIDLSCVTNLVMDVEGRPNANTARAFSTLFQPYGFNTDCMSNAFSCLVNSCISMRMPTPTPLHTVYLDRDALHRGRCKIVNRGTYGSIAVCDSGKVLPRCRVVIVSQKTGGNCNSNEIGEIWVESPHNNREFTGLSEELLEDLRKEHFNLNVKRLEGNFANTGYLGFLHSGSGKSNKNGDILFVLGGTNDRFEMYNREFFLSDVESFICNSTPLITDCVCMKIGDHVIFFVETEDPTSMALTPMITTNLLNIGIALRHLVFLPMGTITYNIRGEKNRLHIASAFSNEEMKNCVQITNNL